MKKQFKIPFEERENFLKINKDNRLDQNVTIQLNTTKDGYNVIVDGSEKEIDNYLNALKAFPFGS